MTQKKKKIEVSVQSVKKVPKDRTASVKKSETNWQAEQKIQERRKKLSALIEKVRNATQNPKLINADLVDNFEKATSFSSTEEYMLYRDFITTLLICASDFDSNKIKASGSELTDIQIKKLAAQKVIKIAKELGILEYGVLIYSTTNGRYISNATLNMLEELADELIAQNMHQPILHKLRSYLELGGMMCPGDTELTPFTKEKQLRIQILVKRFETQNGK